jgi:hypothetical protein
MADRADPRGAYRLAVQAVLHRPVRAEDGRETVVSYNATTFNDREGKLQGVFAAARDVTEHKALEEQATRRTRSSREPGSACTSARNWPGSSAA